MLDVLRPVSREGRYQGETKCIPTTSKILSHYLQHGASERAHTHSDTHTHTQVTHTHTVIHTHTQVTHTHTVIHTHTGDTHTQ